MMLNAFLLALREIRNNLLRAGLTTLGIVIGVAAVIAMVTLGTGQKASNQRGLRESPYIADFTATGTIGVDEGFVDPKAVKEAIAWGGQFVGIGASRKMGWGRFELRAFKNLK